MLLKDGMQVRAQAILTPSEINENEVMGRYFTREFIYSADKVLKEKYRDYDINSTFIYNLKINKLWCWPWQITATAEVTETITNIKGALISGKEPSGEAEPPKWENGRYKVTLRKVNSAWKIESIELIETAQATPTPSPTQVQPTPTGEEPSPSPTVPVGEERYGIVNTSVLNMRSEPVIGDNIIARLDSGTRVLILDDSIDGWYKVRFGEREGYVSKDYIVEDNG